MMNEKQLPNLNGHSLMHLRMRSSWHKFMVIHLLHITDPFIMSKKSLVSLSLSLPSSAIQESQEFTFTLQFTCFFYFSIFVHPRDDNFTHSLMRNVKYQCSSIGKHIFRFHSHIKVEMIREMKIVLNYAHFIRFLNSNCDFCVCVCL